MVHSLNNTVSPPPPPPPPPPTKETTHRFTSVEWGVLLNTHMESLEGLLDENECDVLLTWSPWKAYWMRMSVMYYSHGVLGRPIRWEWVWCITHMESLEGLLDENECDVLLTWSPWKPIGWEWMWCITHMESLEGLLDENECDVLLTWGPWKAYWMRMSVMYYSHGVLARPIDENECDVLLTWSPLEGLLDENECDVLLTWSPWKAYWMRMSVMYYSHGVLGRPIRWEWMWCITHMGPWKAYWMRMSVMYYSHGVLGRPIRWEWMWCITHMGSLEGLLDENECDVLLTRSPWKAYWMRMSVM